MYGRFDVIFDFKRIGISDHPPGLSTAIQRAALTVISVLKKGTGHQRRWSVGYGSQYHGRARFETIIKEPPTIYDGAHNMKLQ